MLQPMGLQRVGQLNNNKQEKWKKRGNFWVHNRGGASRLSSQVLSVAGQPDGPVPCKGGKAAAQWATENMGSVSVFLSSLYGTKQFILAHLHLHDSSFATFPIALTKS